MHPRRQSRIELLSQHVAAQPLREDVVAEEYDYFAHTGELPDDQRLAVAVVDLALRGGPAPVREELSPQALAELIRSIAEWANKSEAEPEPPARPSLRPILFHEALHGDDLERQAARLALRIEVHRGGDVASPAFLADRSPPEHACLGLHLIGFPERLAKPPYVEQARRLIESYRELRARIDHDDPEWFAPIADAIPRFRRHGELPDDELVQASVLADGELLALIANYCGHGDPEILAAFDTAANADDATRGAALARLQELAREGRLLPEIE